MRSSRARFARLERPKPRRARNRRSIWCRIAAWWTSVGAWASYCRVADAGHSSPAGDGAGGASHEERSPYMSEPSRDDDITEIVDEIVDDMDPVRVDREAERLDLGVDELLGLVVAEVKARVRS